MINSGMGLCVELAHDDKTDRSLYAVCEQVGADVKVRSDCLSPFVVATPDTETSWCWGHYFDKFENAVEYLMKGEI